MKKVLHKPYRLTVKLAKKIANFDQIINENQYLREQNSRLEENVNFGHPKGHFYSPVHSIEDLTEHDKVLKRSKSKSTKTIPGFSKKRLATELEGLTQYFKDFRYPIEDDNQSRFYTGNPSYPTLDAVTLFSMVRKHKPKRIIEIGSGFSSGLIMGINDDYFNSKIDMTFIEPYPELLYQRMRRGEKSRYRVIPRGVQDVDLKVFKTLKEEDILFIDSTHVSKFNSDVNYEIFDILPELNKGVIIHFHDIFEGFEYPINWLNDGWAWNEDYLLRAFLMNNSEYEILAFNDYSSRHFAKSLTKAYPKEDKNILNGGSLWLRKV